MIIDEMESTATYESIDACCRQGIGYTYIAGNKVCAFCTSEYPSRSSVAIGVKICELHQRQGIATDMVQMFLQQAAKRHFMVYWDCWEQNASSVKTALACGFRKVADYPVLLVAMRK